MKNCFLLRDGERIPKNMVLRGVSYTKTLSYLGEKHQQIQDGSLVRGYNTQSSKQVAAALFQQFKKDRKLETAALFVKLLD